MIKRKPPPKVAGHTHEIEQAKIDGVKLSTKRKERSLGKGQAYIKLNRRVYYIDADRPRYLESLRRVPPSRETAMRVFVVMTNDFPAAVFSTIERAQQDIDRRVAEINLQRQRGLNRGFIHHHIHQFEVDHGSADTTG